MSSIKLVSTPILNYYDSKIKAYMDDKFAKKNDTVSNPNLLINPNFKINQRGITSGQVLESGKYTVDRWAVNYNTGGFQKSITITSESITLTTTLGNDSGYWGDMYQKFETPIPPGYYSMSAKINGEIRTFSGYLEKDGVLFDGVFVLYQTSFRIRFGIDEMTIEWVKLEVGPVATQFVPPDPATELMKCYRYFYRVGRGIANPNHTSNFNRICYQNISNKIAGTTLQFPVEMRVTPTASVIGTPWCFRLFTNNGENVVVAGADNVNFNLQKFGYEIVIINDYFANAVDGFIAPLFATGYTDFDAEIY